MIKSRGYRIELGDIETTLYNHPKIASVALLAVPDEQISHRLVPHSDIGAPDALRQAQGPQPRPYICHEKTLKNH